MTNGIAGSAVSRTRGRLRCSLPRMSSASGTSKSPAGTGVTASALNRDNAVTLIEWLATEGQAADDTGVWMLHGKLPSF